MKKRKISMLIAIGIMLLGGTVKVQAEGIRLGGVDRYDTSTKISQSGWTSADNVVLTTGTGNNTYADALSGTVLAYKLNAPILLTDINSLNSNIANEITRLKAKNVYILGGYGVVSSEVEAQLKSQGYNVSRIAGSDRYQTATKIAEQTLKMSPSNTAYITTGHAFQYAMVTSPVASVNNKILLFSEADGLNQTTKNFLLQHPEITNIVLVGDSNYASDKLVSDLKSLSRNVTTKTGNLTEIEKQYIQENKGKFTNLSVANDSLYADALGGAVLSAKNKSMLILTGTNSIDSSLKETIDSTLDSKSATVFGGTGAISDIIYNQVTGNAPIQQLQPSNDAGYYNTELASQLKSKIDNYRKTKQLNSGNSIEFQNAVQQYVDSYAKTGTLNTIAVGNTITISDTLSYKIYDVVNTRISTQSSDVDTIFNQLLNSGDLANSNTTDLNVSVYSDGTNNYVAVVTTSCSVIEGESKINWTIVPTQPSNAGYNSELASQLQNKIGDYRRINNQGSFTLPNFRNAVQQYVNLYAKTGTLNTISKGNTITISDSEKYEITNVVSTRISTKDTNIDNIFNQLKDTGILASGNTVDLMVGVYNDGTNNYVSVVLTDCTKVGHSTTEWDEWNE